MNFIKIVAATGHVDYVNIEHVVNAYVMPPETPEERMSVELFLTQNVSTGIDERVMHWNEPVEVAQVLAQLDALSVQPAARELVLAD